MKSWNEKKWGLAKTCPMSRHAVMIANDMRSNRRGCLGRALREAGYDADHMADSIEGVVIGLWRARCFLEWDAKVNDWLPDTPTQGDI